VVVLSMEKLTTANGERRRKKMGEKAGRGNGGELRVSRWRGDLACASWPWHQCMLATRRAPPVPGRPLSRPSSNF
jgi:hypothetical protein